MYLMIVRSIATWLILQLAGLVLVAQDANPIWEPPFKHGIAAVAEERIITYEELRREMAPLIGQIRQKARNSMEFEQLMSQLYFDVLQDLIDRVLIVKEFNNKEYNIPQTIIENEYDRILIEDFNDDRRKFLESLQEQGKTVSEFRSELKENIIVSVMRGEMRKSLSEISPEKIENFYHTNKIHFFQEESVHLRLIMLKPLADEPKDLLRQNAERIIQKLDKGAEFSEIAREESQDSRGKKGGDWGWINRADLRPELSKAAFALDPHQYSQPIELGEQIFILYLEDKMDEGIQVLAEVRDTIENILAGQIARKAQDRWMKRLRKDSYVRFFWSR